MPNYIYIDAVNGSVTPATKHYATAQDPKPSGAACWASINEVWSDSDIRALSDVEIELVNGSDGINSYVRLSDNPSWTRVKLISDKSVDLSHDSSKPFWTWGSGRTSAASMFRADQAGTTFILNCQLLLGNAGSYGTLAIRDIFYVSGCIVRYENARIAIASDVTGPPGANLGDGISGSQDIRYEATIFDNQSALTGVTLASHGQDFIRSIGNNAQYVARNCASAVGSVAVNCTIPFSGTTDTYCASEDATPSATSITVADWNTAFADATTGNFQPVDGSPLEDLVQGASSITLASDAAGEPFLKGFGEDAGVSEIDAVTPPDAPTEFTRYIYNGNAPTDDLNKTLWGKAQSEPDLNNTTMVTGDAFYVPDQAGVTWSLDSSFVSDDEYVLSGVYLWIASTDTTTGTTSVTIEENTTAPADTTADSFAVNNVGNVETSTLISTNDVTVSGLGSGVSVTASITGGQFAVSTNGGSTFGAVSAANQSVDNGYVIRPYAQSSASFSTSVTATLSFGGQSDSYTVTTRAATAPVLPTISAQTFTVSEDIQIGQVFATVQATNADSFTIEAGDIDINSAGGLSFNTQPDYDTEPQYTPTVTATNSDGTATATITVNVTEVVAGTAPVVEDQTFSITENNAINQIIGTLAVANDPDSITFNDARIAISNSNLSITALEVFDFESLTTFDVSVTAANSFGSDTATLTFNILDDSDTAPVLTDYVRPDAVETVQLNITFSSSSSGFFRYQFTSSESQPEKGESYSSVPIVAGDNSINIRPPGQGDYYLHRYTESA